MSLAADQPSPAGQAPAAASIGQSAARGAAWGASSAILYQMVALIVQVQLTYLLTKTEYGTYGVAVAVLNFATLVQQVGFNEVLQHRRTSLHLWVNPAAWLAAALGLVGAAIVAAAAWPLSAAYKDAALFHLVLLMAPVPVARAMTILPIALMFERMRFRLLYTIMASSAVLNSLLVLALAWRGHGVYSFVIAMLITEPLYVAVLWMVSRPRVRGNPQYRRWKFMLRDLGLVFGSNVARWTRASADVLLLGLVATKDQVGIYAFGLTVPVQIVRVVTLNLASALLPALNRMQHNPRRQAEAFVNACGALMVVGAPMCIGLAAVSGVFTRLFLDAQKWHDLPPVLAILSVGVAFRLLDEPIQALLAAQGRFRAGFRLSVATAIGFLAFALAGAVIGGAPGTAVAVAAFFMMAGPWGLYIAVRPAAIPVRRVLAVFWGPVLLSAAAIGPWAALERFIPAGDRWREAAVLAGMIGFSAAAYVLLATLLRVPAWRELLDRAEPLAPGRTRFLFRILKRGG